MSNLERIKTIRSVRKANRVTNLDFSISENNNYFLNLYGGLDNLRDQFPLFHQAYEKTLEAHKNGIGLDYMTLRQTGDEVLNNFVDGIDIEYVNYTITNNKLEVCGVTSLTEISNYIDQHMEIRTSEGEIVAGLSTSTESTSRASIEINTDFDPCKFKSNILEIDYTCVWINSKNGLLKAQIASEDHEELYINNIVKNIKLNNPIKKQNPDLTKVVACYDRIPQLTETVDYIYQEAIDYIDGKLCQKLILEFGASVEFYENTADFKSIIPQSFILRLTSERGMAKYSTTDRMKGIESRFTNTNNGFVFNLDSDWKDTVPSAMLPIHDNVDIHMEVNFNLQDGKKGSITISSMVSSNESSPSVCKALPLNLLWGCLSKDTLVTMAEGKEKLISEIEIGDKVLSNHNKFAVVTNTWKGAADSPLLCIETENKHKIKCSSQHPVVTLNGIKTAALLNGSDSLIDKDGNSVAIVAIYYVEEEGVYNLDLCPEEGEDLKKGMTMICNGLLVGDNVMQNNIKNLEKETVLLNIHQEECRLKNKFFNKKGV